MLSCLYFKVNIDLNFKFLHKKNLFLQYFSSFSFPFQISKLTIVAKCRDFVETKTCTAVLDKWRITYAGTVYVFAMVFFIREKTNFSTIISIYYCINNITYFTTLKQIKISFIKQLQNLMKYWNNSRKWVAWKAF